MGAEISPEVALRTVDEELQRGFSLLAAATSQAELEKAESAVLGRKSPLAQVSQALGSLSAEERRRVGRRTNEVRQALRAAAAERRVALEAGIERALLEADRIDGTLPGRR